MSGHHHPTTKLSRFPINSDEYHVPIDGFSQIIKTDGLLFLSGLTSRTADGTIIGVGDPTAQMNQIFDNLRTILASLRDVRWKTWSPSGPT